ncbi:MAG: hypothetical protein N2515_00545, partial [Deltaproteobacteria bacterium]|nr:hypothetical protein [Deltaproteobacteria bacterium]
LSGEIQERAQSALREAQRAHLQGEAQSFELHCQRVEEWLALARMEEENNRLEKEALRLEEELSQLRLESQGRSEESASRFASQGRSFPRRKELLDALWVAESLWSEGQGRWSEEQLLQAAELIADHARLWVAVALATGASIESASRIEERIDAAAALKDAAHRLRGMDQAYAEARRLLANARASRARSRVEWQKWLSEDLEEDGFEVRGFGEQTETRICAFKENANFLHGRARRLQEAISGYPYHFVQIIAEIPIGPEKRRIKSFLENRLNELFGDRSLRKIVFVQNRANLCLDFRIGF